MSAIKVEKDIFVRDEKSGVRRRVFVAGTSVPEAKYNRVLSSSTIVNPQDLPQKPEKPETLSLHSTPVMVNKMLPETEPEVKEVEEVKSEPVTEVDSSEAEDTTDESVSKVEPEKVETVKPKAVTKKKSKKEKKNAK